MREPEYGKLSKFRHLHIDSVCLWKLGLPDHRDNLNVPPNHTDLSRTSANELPVSDFRSIVFNSSLIHCFPFFPNDWLGKILNVSEAYQEEQVFIIHEVPL